MVRECSSLKENEQVVFNRYCDIFKDKVPETGSVVSVNLNNSTVCVSWLEGYKDRKDDVPFEDMLAAYNPEGEMMRFKNIYGKSDTLVPFLEKSIENEEEFEKPFEQSEKEFEKPSECNEEEFGEPSERSEEELENPSECNEEEIVER